MNKILIVVYCLFFVELSVGHATEYSFVKTLDEQVQKVIPAQNGNFYALSTQLNCPDDLVIVRYLNKQGDVQSTFTSPPFIGTLLGLDAVVNATNNLVLYIKMNDINHIMYELTSTGTIVWNNNIQFTNPVLTYTQITLAPNGYFLLGNTKVQGGSDSTKAILTKINTIGKHLWTKQYSMNNSLTSSTNFVDMHYENNQLICVGRYFYTSLAIGWPPFRPIVCIVDTSGNIQQSYAYTIDSSMFGFDEYQFVQIVKTPLGAYYALAYNAGNEHALFKLDATFNISWIKEKLSGKAWKICAGFNEDVLIVPDYPSNNYVLHFDANGTIITNHITKSAVGGTNMFGSIRSIEKDECGFLLSNDDRMIAHTNTQMNYCIDSTSTAPISYYDVNVHTRANVALSVNSLTSLNEYLMTSTFVSSTSVATSVCSNAYVCNGPTSIANMVLQDIVAFPNPATTSLTIRMPSSATTSKIQMIDMQGKIIRQVNFANINEIRLDVHDLLQGMYVLKLFTDEKVSIQKIYIDK